MNINIELETWEFIVLNFIAPITAGVYYTVKHYLKNRYMLISSKGQKKDGSKN